MPKYDMLFNNSELTTTLVKNIFYAFCFVFVTLILVFLMNTSSIFKGRNKLVSFRQINISFQTLFYYLTQLDMFFWLNTLFTLTVVTFYCYVYLILIFLPKISSIIVKQLNNLKDHNLVVDKQYAKQSCVLFILNVPVNPVNGIYTVKKATNKFSRLSGELHSLELNTNVLLHQHNNNAHSWQRHYLNCKNAENLLCDQLSSMRDTFPPVAPEVIQGLNSRLIRMGIETATASRNADVSRFQFEKAVLQSEKRLTKARKLVESAQEQLDLLNNLNELSFFERIGYCISESPVVKKVLLYAVEVVCYWLKS